MRLSFREQTPHWLFDINIGIVKELKLQERDLKLVLYSFIISGMFQIQISRDSTSFCITPITKLTTLHAEPNN